MIFELEEGASAIHDVAVTSISGTSEIPQYLIHPLPIEGCIYRGEGNANLVIALRSVSFNNRKDEHKVIRLRKSFSSESKLEENARYVCREVYFIRNVISAFFGCYVCVPEILHLDQAEIVRLSEKIRPDRPENRRSKGIMGGYATKFPDYAFPPESLFGFSSKPIFCVEIKPKQGFLCKADREFKKCPYCLTQYYKRHTGRAKEVSGYCPFDLFSGEESRMKRALKALLRSPQNNLKIFKDGALVYDEALANEGVLDAVLRDWFSSSEPSEDFSRLARSALLRAFDADRELPEVTTYELADELRLPSRLNSELRRKVYTLLADVQECELSDCSLPQGSVLERIFRMQEMHRCGLDIVAWIRDKFSAILSDEFIQASLTSTGDFSPSAHVPVNVRKIKVQRKKKLCDWILQDDVLNYKVNSNSLLLKKNDLDKPKKQISSNKIINEGLLKNITVDDIFNILKNYLMFCTAKDCSILMAFQEVNKQVASNIESQNLIKVSKDQLFLVSVRILDLDMKSLLCIEKHCQRDNSVLRAVIEELEKK